MISDERAAEIKEEQRQIQEGELIEIGCANSDKDQQIQELLADHEERIEHEQAVIAWLNNKDDELHVKQGKTQPESRDRRNIVAKRAMIIDILDFIRNPQKAEGPPPTADSGKEKK